MDVLTGGGGDRPRLSERWHALPRRARRLVGALLAAGLIAGAAAGVLHERPRQADTPVRTAPRRVPYPVHSTRIGFVRTAAVDAGERSFRVELRVVTRDPVLVRRVTQDYEALEMGLSPARTVVVRPGRPARVWVKARITSCRKLPVSARLPFLEVTLRNARATQDLSIIPGRRYARALTRAFRTVCGPASGS
ncbi:hypothetical protein FM076_07500 [Streptomyces albus subsp. chlorinus]|uniref:hypothetical protein n=1 Tax=Streptomyces albus TaxID=1888 RepID=UPI00156FEBC6|nr:hypothetical protein [Streptomyces albus]NSC21064.1 hypothetical protein [Streptomyces albus subsp. chlorinus]